MALVVFILVLSFLVLIHEAGHAVAARIFGVKVYEFGFGYPPKARKLFWWKGIEFTLNWLPVGGFVRLAGEERDVEGEEHTTDTKTKPEEMFYNKRKWQRISIILAGAIVNFIFGVMAFGVMFSILGIPEEIPVERGVLITDVAVDSPGEKAGLLPEDLITAVKISDQTQMVNSADEFVGLVKMEVGREVGLLIERHDETKDLSVYVRQESEIPVGEGAVGIGIADSKYEFVKYPLWQRPIRGAWYGIKAAIDFGWLILLTLGTMMREMIFAGTIPADVAGPVGIVYSAQKTGILNEGWLGLLNFAAILSINLAIVNVLPIPALDGGRALFVFLEKLMGKRFKPIYERYANVAGFVFLLALVGLISVRDVGVIIKDVLGQ